MTFPAVAGRQTTMAGLPTIAFDSAPSSGDLIIIVFQSGFAGTASAPGWTVPVGALGTWVLYRICDGSEGSSVTITYAAGGGLAARAWRIRGFTGAPEFGIAASKNPPSLSPSWGAKDTLWIAALGLSGTYSGFPSGYTQTGSVTNLGWAERELNAASEDPSAFTSSSGAFIESVTIAVQGIVSGGDALFQRSLVPVFRGVFG